MKFFISMKAIKKAMDPPTQEAMMTVSVLSTTLTENRVEAREYDKKGMREEKRQTELF